MSQAQEIAANFFEGHGIATDSPVHLNVRMKSPAKSVGNKPYYIFNSSDESAFVIVSGDSRTHKVLAYSTENGFDVEHVAPGASFMLGEFEEYIGSLQDGNYEPTEKRKVNFGSGKLIQTALWNQSYDFWWSQCPVVNGKNTHAGCTAVAMAILMRHYEWPLRGYGSKSYTTETHGLNLGADFTEFDYNWGSLPKGNQNDTGWNTANKNLVAKILKQCGVAASMDYDTSGSGARTTNQAVGLYRYYGYSIGSYITMEDCDENKWYSYIIDEIDGDNPILYQGQDDSDGGHAFICDGYDSNGYLHFNFGWSGKSNGYYSIHDSNMTYHNKHTMIIGIRPDYDAGNRELADFVMKKSERGDHEGIEILNDGELNLGGTFDGKIYQLMNFSDADVAFNVAVFVCDEQGNPKMKLGEYNDLSLQRGSSYSWVQIRCGIPFDYEYEDTDCLMAFSSTDGGETWKKVECYDPELGRIKMADVYNPIPKYLEMAEIQDKGIGLAIREGYTLNAEGKRFYVTANCLQNISVSDFTGEVAAFLCDRDGNRKLQIGTSSMQGLQPRYYYSTWNISCVISSNKNVDLGDRICLFARSDGDSGWSYVDCANPGKAYIEIPDETSGIETIDADEFGANFPVYNLQGIKVDNPGRGIFIINGKKVIKH